MKKKNVVIITGGSGYIGSALIEKLHPDFDVVNLDSATPVKTFPGVLYHKIDLSSDEDIRKTLGEISRTKGKKIESLIHLAGHYDFTGKDHPLYQRVNVEGTRSLLRRAREILNLRQFQFASSMLVYRPTEPGHKITEDSPLEGAWAYPRSKMEAEKIIREEKGEIPSVILRIAAVYNEFGYAPSIAHQIMRLSELQLTSFFFPGDRRHVQSAIHVEDLAEAMVLSLKKKNELGDETILSLAEDETPSYDEIQKTVGHALFEQELPYLWIPKTLARMGARILKAPFIEPWMIDFADANFDLDNSMAKNILAWTPAHSLRETLPLILKNLQAYPGTWYSTNKSKLPSPLIHLRKQILRSLHEKLRTPSTS